VLGWHRPAADSRECPRVDVHVGVDETLGFVAHGTTPRRLDNTLAAPPAANRVWRETVGETIPHGLLMRWSDMAEAPFRFPAYHEWPRFSPRRRCRCGPES